MERRYASASLRVNRDGHVYISCFVLDLHKPKTICLGERAMYKKKKDRTDEQSKERNKD